MYQKRSVRTSKREDCRAEGTNGRQMVRHSFLKAWRSAKNTSHLSENSLKYWKREITSFTVSALNPAAVSSCKTQDSPVDMSLIITSKGPQTLCWPASAESRQETCARVRFAVVIPYFTPPRPFLPKTFFTFLSELDFGQDLFRMTLKGTKAVASCLFWAKSQGEGSRGWESHLKKQPTVK